MRLFYMLVAAVLVSAGGVLTYDLFQAEIERGQGAPRIRFDAATGRFTFRRPEVSVRIVYASMFGPGEPVMRVRGKWVRRFEEEYSDLLASRQGLSIPEADRGPLVRVTLNRVAPLIPEARRRLAEIAAQPDPREQDRLIDELEARLEDGGIFLSPLGPKSTQADKLKGLTDLVAGLEGLAGDPAAAAGKVAVAPLLVDVDCRWQGRWVLSANRPRFLTGREVPDIMEGGMMELLALVQDGYALPLGYPDPARRPDPGEGPFPLDGPDTFGDPDRKWRDAFYPTMLAEGAYDFLPDPRVNQKVYLAPLTCASFCIFYNQVLFQRAKILRPPRSWPEFMEVCERLKAAGITPLTADGTSYCQFWMTWLLFRAVGQEAWRGTLVGVPPEAPPRQRRSDPPWTDQRYRRVFAEVRALHERGYFDKHFRGSQWPAAQREFAKGSAAMMINGSWLVQELSGYRERAGEGRFRLGCFSFPQWPGGREPDQRAAHASIFGLMVCRQGRAGPHAVELLKYLSARDHGDMVHRNAQISCMKDADFPPDLAGIEPDFARARAEGLIYSRGPDVYARRFNSEALGPAYNRFFLEEPGRRGTRTVDEFLRDLARLSAEYLRGGGEEGYE